MVLRRAVEALGPALKENRAPDYSLTLGQIAKTQAVIGARLGAMEGHPALRLTPAAFARNRRLAQAAALGGVVGLVLLPLLGFPIARILPFGSLPDALASAALGEDGWSGGAGLMSRANPAQ